MPSEIKLPYLIRIKTSVSNFLDKKTPLSGMVVGLLAGCIIGGALATAAGVGYGAWLLGEVILAATHSIPLVIGYCIIVCTAIICSLTGLFTNNFK